jgi:hypothetical protein
VEPYNVLLGQANDIPLTLRRKVVQQLSLFSQLLFVCKYQTGRRLTSRKNLSIRFNDTLAIKLSIPADWLVCEKR